MTLWTAPNEEIQKIDVNPEDGQSQSTDVVPIEQYKALQSTYTANRQYMIDMALESAKANPQSISSIKDEKLQSTVVKQLYGVDSYAQLVAIHWEDFYNKSDEDGDEDSTKKLEREVKILKFNAEKSEVENALREFKITNPQYFTNPKNEEQLRNELRYVSGELTPSERIRRAAAIAFVPSADPATLAYQVLNTWNNGGGNAQIQADKAKDAEKQKQIDAGRALFGLKPAK